MGFIPEQQINDLKDRIDIVEVISKYVELKRAGSSFKGLCPFHNEKTPSFMVSREKNNFHCFGCHEGGDAISFIMKIENISYIESIKFLADDLGIILEEENYNKEKLELSKRYYDINSLAGRFYFKNMVTNETPQKYLENRGIKLNILNKFFLGYAKNDNSLYSFLKSQNIDENDMLKLGLIGKSNNGGYYDKFRDRLVFPILNNKNKVIGFGARTLIDHNIKYLNSPESDIFIKGKNLYGVHIVNKSRNNNKILLVEGYMDVIGLYNQGIDYAVATLGTSLTEDQARLVKRYGSEIYIAYDGDNAGIKATLRAIDIFKNLGVQLGILSFPGGMDPDEYINKYGKEKFYELLNKAKDPIDFKLEKLSDQNLSKMDFIKEIINFLVSIEGNVIRDLYTDKSARFLGVTTDSLRRDIENERKRLEKKDSRLNRNFNNNNNYGYKKDTLTAKKTANNKALQLQKEFLIISMLDLSIFKLLEKYKSILEEEQIISLYSTIENAYKNKLDIKNLIEKIDFRYENIDSSYLGIYKDKCKWNLMANELISRLQKDKLEKRKVELQNLISEGDTRSEILKEYSEILKNLT